MTRGLGEVLLDINRNHNNSVRGVDKKDFRPGLMFINQSSGEKPLKLYNV